MLPSKWMCAVVVFVLWSFPAFAQRKVYPLQFSLGDLEVKGPWIYNDVKAGFAQARSSRKPLLVIFRCVP